MVDKRLTNNYKIILVTKLIWIGRNFYLEFSEKLQQLRKKSNLTQEQLAEHLFVSRTAISKWESGKGYPSIDSLKSISKFFLVSIDELLSGEELLDISASENAASRSKIYGLLYGVLDIMVIAIIFLPFFGQPEENFIRGVNLLGYTNTSNVFLIIYWTLLLLIISAGGVQIILRQLEKIYAGSMVAKYSIGLKGLAIVFFAAAREPYVTAFLFLIFAIKLFIQIKEIQKR